MLHTMNLKPEPFEHMACGTKTIELRLYDEKRRLIQVGDTLVFHHTEDSTRTLTAVVTALHCYPDFVALYDALPLERCGYRPEELADASPSDMDAYYSREKQARYGVVGIELQLKEEDI